MRQRRDNAFTLAEVLVVLMIVGILASLLFPVIAQARPSGTSSAVPGPVPARPPVGRAMANPPARLARRSVGFRLPRRREAAGSASEIAFRDDGVI